MLQGVPTAPACLSSRQPGSSGITNIPGPAIMTRPLELAHHQARPVGLRTLATRARFCKAGPLSSWRIILDTDAAVVEGAVATNGGKKLGWVDVAWGPNSTAPVTGRRVPAGSRSPRKASRQCLRGAAGTERAPLLGDFQDEVAAHDHRCCEARWGGCLFLAAANRRCRGRARGTGS